MLTNKINQRKKSLEELHERQKGLEEREADLEVAIGEATSDEELEVVERSIDELETEKSEVDDKKSALEEEITTLEGELEALNSKEPKDESHDERANEIDQEKRGAANMPTARTMSRRQQVVERMNRPEVRSFYENVKRAMEQRSISGLDLTIPEILLDTITDDLGRYSVFYDKVRKVNLTGTGRAIVAGEAPEAVWTEMIGKLNELGSLFDEVEVDGYKVGGFIPVHNSLIEDSLINLASHIEELLKESIAIALDKAILYGTGTKMPLGIITAIYNDYVADPESGLRTTNLITLSAGDTTFAKISEQFKHVKRGRKGRGPITVCMNESTWTGTIVPMSLGRNAAGAFVAVTNKVFPGLGYQVEFCEEIPENEIVAGDFSKYLLAQRTGVKTASSTEFLFTEDKTVFKGTQRFDGKPVKESAFIVIGINGKAPTTSATFAADDANA